MSGVSNRVEIGVSALMWRKRTDENAVEDPLEYLSEAFDKGDTAPVRKKSGAIAGLSVLTIVMGLIMALLITPLMIPSVAAAQAGNHYWKNLDGELPDLPLPQRSKLYTADGKEIAEFYSINRVNVSLDEVPDVVKEALINTEDARFYDHEGLDRRGILRALITNITGGGISEGASTLTQQVVKNTLIVNAATEEEVKAASEQTIERKVEEIKYAVELEKKYSKDEILEQYLNISLFSNGVYGIGTAANYYFSKSVDELTLEESALLIGLLKNPTGYNPKKNPENAIERRNVVLGQMLRYGSITDEEYEEAKDTPLELNLASPAQGCEKSAYPYYCLWAIETLRESNTIAPTQEERDALMYRGGLKVTTNLDVDAQKKLQDTVNQALGKNNRVASSIVTVEPGTGAVVAMAQNRNFGDPSKDSQKTKHTEVDYSTRVAFQSGSVFKMFTLAAALESGMSVDAVVDTPNVYKPKGKNYPPGGFKNATRGASGPLTMYEGTARSSNTFFVKLQNQVGVLNVAEMAESMGISVPREGPYAVTEEDAAFTLGTIDVSPVQIANAYATISSGGIYCTPTPIQKIEAWDDRPVPNVEPDCERVMAETTADNVTDVLKGVIDGKDDSRTGKRQSLGRPAAGKTGTTNSAGAAWFAGFTPQYATAVWAGDPRGGSKYPLSSGVRLYGDYISGVAGSTVPGPIWKNAMEDLHEGKEKLPLAGASADTVPNSIPDVRGMEVSAAVTVLQNAGFEVSISGTMAEENEYSSPNHVAWQTPEPGDLTTSKSHVQITLELTHGSDETWTVGP